ncbi:MAG: hypothetical protein ABI649_09415 [Gaiellaceae bacterium]
MPSERIAVIGKLKPGMLEQAEQIVEAGPPFDVKESGLRQHSVFLGAEWVVFVFEGPEVERVVHGLVNDPVASAGFGVWAPLLEETPHLVQERYSWQANGQ